jgi:hypothetical protein
VWCCKGSYPYFLLNIMIHSSPVCSRDFFYCAVEIDIGLQHLISTSIESVLT